MNFEEYKIAKTLSGVGLICSTGIINEYRHAEYQGLLGSTGEETWNRKKHWHDCCKSKVAWRYMTTCPRATGDGNLPPGFRTTNPMLLTWMTYF